MMLIIFKVEMVGELKALTIGLEVMGFLCTLGIEVNVEIVREVL